MHEAVVGGIVGALGGVHVAPVLALVGLDPLRRELDRGQRLVPAAGSGVTSAISSSGTPDASSSAPACCCSRVSAATWAPAVVA